MHKSAAKRHPNGCGAAPSTEGEVDQVRAELGRVQEAARDRGDPAAGLSRSFDATWRSAVTAARAAAGPPDRAFAVACGESLGATLRPMVDSIPEDDWVSAEAEALLDATPGLREDLRAAMEELHAGTLQTVEAATARARIEARTKTRGSS